MYEFSPFLVQLQDCSFMRDTFTSISNNKCPGLEQYSWDVYVGLVVISAGVMFSIVASAGDDGTWQWMAIQPEKTWEVTRTSSGGARWRGWRG